MQECSKGCRIVVGWDADETNVQVLHKTIFCVVSAAKYSFKSFYTFVYAANEGFERKSLWKELIKEHRYVNGKPWCIAGDMNVTLKVSEHSCGSSVMTADMVDFQECLNKIEIEDICKTGLHFTWTKNLQKTKAGNMTRILKKLDRVMSNEEFIKKFSNAHANTEIHAYYMYQVVQKLKSMKIPLNKLGWSEGNLFKRVETLRGQLQKVQTDIDKDPHNHTLRNMEANLVKEFYEAEEDEEKNFLGKAHLVQDIEDCSTLFQRRVSEEAALNMIADVSDNKIKKAMFDIDDSKAPGPDGFTSAFFKKAWAIVGTDVCKAVREFFNSGRMLGEINATLISLIPKVHTPSKVTDFRPIACCNVLYKCISKVITNRIKLVLGSLLSSNQSAFIPGRQIQDNIMLTQELMKGYNRKRGPKRVACKIDLQKAYDTKDSKFQYHFGCKVLKLVHVCFADDLLVMCHGDTSSVEVIKRALDEFSASSGMLPNSSKSTVFFGSLCDEERDAITNILPFFHWEASINNWKNRSLSYAGRLQLIVAVLESVHVYWASVFLLPTTIINKINKLLKWDRNGNDMKLSVHTAYNDMTIQHPVVSWWKLIWFSQCIPKHSFIVWLAFQDRLSTQDKFQKCRDCVVNRCSLCCQDAEDIKHLLFLCPFSKDLWAKVRRIADIRCNSFNLMSIMQFLTDDGNGNNIRSIVRRIAFAACIYNIWQEKNGRIFREVGRNYDEVFKNIMDKVKHSLLGLTVKDSPVVRDIESK
ncbi:RNA-directed DNA polymerase, eukaryota, reverse transcriptase zinc-binding domain protein [Tanacetum coccineum]